MYTSALWHGALKKKNADLLKASSCQKHCLNATDKSTTLT